MKKRTFNWFWIPLALFTGFIPSYISTEQLGVVYGIVGILFGVGFSLIISSVYKDVKHAKMRMKMRYNVINIRERFVIYFVISTVSYILAFYVRKSWLVWSVDCVENTYIKTTLVWFVNHYHYTATCLATLLVSIAVYVRNYISLQKLNDELDEELV